MNAWRDTIVKVAILFAALTIIAGCVAETSDLSDTDRQRIEGLLRLLDHPQVDPAHDYQCVRRSTDGEERDAIDESARAFDALEAEARRAIADRSTYAAVLEKAEEHLQKWLAVEASPSLVFPASIDFMMCATLLSWTAPTLLEITQGIRIVPEDVDERELSFDFDSLPRN